MRDNSALRKIACTLVFVRHAASKGAGSFVGQKDEPLSAAGRKQLRELVQKLSRFHFQAAFASDLKRALATARAILQHTDVELEIRPALREMHFGRWQGLSWKQVAKRHPRLASLWLKHLWSQPIPGGERFGDFKHRVKTELKKIVKTNQGRCVLVVTHAGVIRMALADALGMKEHLMFRMAQDPCAINVVDYFADGVTVRCVNG
jgi:broad specificity phosphatase PhoE